MDALLKDKLAIVTGGNAGIGAAISELFAKQGARVMIFGRNPETGAQVVSNIQEQGGEAEFFSLDISNYQEVTDAITQIQKDKGTVDVLVNNAGIIDDTLLMKMEPDQWQKVINTNLTSVYNTCHGVIRAMLKARSGSIINISSVTGVVGNAGQCNYSAAKAGIHGFTKSLAKESGGRGIRVNAIAPGFIQTEMIKELPIEFIEEMKHQITLKRLGSPQEVANVALFLASDLSSYITGQVIISDGGLFM